MRKLIILSIVLMTSLSATLITNFSELAKKQKAKSSEFESSFENDLEQAKKLKLFSAKHYMEDYERQKKARAMLNESLQRMERGH